MHGRAAAGITRPWRGRVALCALTLAAHAVLLGALLHDDGAGRGKAQAARRPAVQRALQLTWVHSPRDGTTAAARREPPRAERLKAATPGAVRAARATAAPLPAKAIVAPATSPLPPRDAVPDGSVFGLPRIAFASIRAAAAPIDGDTVPSAMQAALLAQQRTQVAAAHDAARAQLHAALQRELGAWPALDRTVTCRVRTSGAECDDDALRAQLLARADALQALLAALRQFEPQADALTIEFRDGRYHGAAQRVPAL